MGVRGAFAIAMGALVGSSVSGALACIVGGTFACTEHADCSGDGVCEPTGWCSFPDQSCESHSRYSPWAGDGLAHECTTPDDGTTTAFGTDGSSEDGGPSGPPAVRDSEGPECGNGIVEVGEACDEEDAIDGDGCNTNCIESGTLRWRNIKVSTGNDQGHDVATTALGESYVVGQWASSNGNGWLLKFMTDGGETQGWSGYYGAGRPDGALGLALREDVEPDCGAEGAAALFWTGYESPYDDPDDENPSRQADQITRRSDDLGGGPGECWKSSLYNSSQTVNTMKRFGDDRNTDVATATGVEFVVAFGYHRDNMTGFDADASARAFRLGSSASLWFWSAGIDDDDDYATAGVVDEEGRIWMVGRRVDGVGDVDAWIAHLAVSDADPPVPTREWTRIYTDNARKDVFEDIARKSNGELVAVGSKGGRAWITTWMPETADNGNASAPLVELEYDLTGEATLYGVAIDGAGAVVVAGTVATAEHGKDAWVEKFDPALEKSVWSHQIDGTAHGDDFARAVAIAPGDVVVVVGDLAQVADDEDGVDQNVWIETYEP
jgi:cysteine-rich repeat protein